MIREKAEGVEEVQIKWRHVNLRKYPSLHSPKTGQAEKGEKYEYLGEWGPWVAIKTKDDQIAFLRKKSLEPIVAQ